MCAIVSNLAELEQKRVNLELSESMNTFLSGEAPGKASPFSDMNNNKVNTQFAELNNLAQINNQIISQLKANNPLSQIEFVSNYSAIQTSIRNTFGYIRINNQMNANQQQQQQVGNKQLPDMTSFNNNANSTSSSSVYDYLNQMTKNNQSRKTQPHEMLHVDLDSFNPSSARNHFNADQNANCFGDNAFDTFSANTFSASSQGSIKSSSSSQVTSSCSGSRNQLQQQKPIGPCHSYYDPATTSPISITTDSLPTTASSTSCFPSSSSTASSSHYFLDQWSNPAADLLTKSKTVNDLDLLTDDFFNSTMLRAKNSWSCMANEPAEVKETAHFSPYFDQSDNNQSPTLTALLGTSKTISENMNKFNSLSASSNKSVASNHSSYFNQKPIDETNKLISGSAT